ncbi:DUF2780 domain-containing protein [Pseudomonas denitrificans (nom. rej.)]|uniref:DUF2780 domain-containing protein n=1 Tax=Pseudomonas denitrificans TaxID=43306 RepID=A0A9X7N4M2_PSEDE|nr:DUF2780 domain-containing protein [Pseudomonas denitrificans (nom. rej.)]QEY74983.1 DUF2780 domain-containing protein [Pseudomonas denitrificans (nom. rej.)]
MPTRSVVFLAACLAVSPVFAATFTDTSEPTTQAQSVPPAASALLGNLTRQLGVSEQQAIGGTGAMLAMAMNSLKETDTAQLQKSLPNLDQLGGNSSLGDLGGALGGFGGLGNAAALLGGINNLQDVDQIFGVLGMDQSMIGRFAGVILDYFTEQGLSSQLLGTLGGLWGTPAAPLTPAAPVAGRGA